MIVPWAVVLAGIATPTASSACPAGRATGAYGDTIVVGYAPSPPFVVTGATAGTNDRSVHGFAIEVLRTLALQEGWRLELSEMTDTTLRTRIAACELDLGVVGTAASAALIAPSAAAEPTLELSYPYFSSVTTAMVDADDEDRAAPAGHSRVRRIARVALRGLGYGLAALGLLALASWGLNAFGGFGPALSLRWRRLDAAVGGPWAGLRWLARSPTGRALLALWLVAGIAVGATGAVDGAAPTGLGHDPVAKLVERAAHGEALFGERYPDGVQVPCSTLDARPCFRGFADGTLSAIAGPREVLCMHAAEQSLDDVVLRDDLDIPEQFAYLLPAGSALRARLDLALLRHHERAGMPATGVRCPERGP